MKKAEVTEGPASPSGVKNARNFSRRACRERRIYCRVVAAIVVLVLGFAGSEILTREVPHPASESMRRAAQRMARAEEAIAAHRPALGIEMDPALDPHRTGLIGVESSILTTTVGDIVAKRTVTSTAFAALVVRYFHDLELVPGEIVAVGSSGSFPGALLAVLAACAETGVQPIVITSIGASEFGANIEGLSDAEMMVAARDASALPYLPAAISPGGDGDRGISSLYRLEPSDDLARYARSLAARLNIPFVGGTDYESAFAAHLTVYERTAQSLSAELPQKGISSSAPRASPIAAFINIGGADINFGSDSASLALKPGLIRPLPRELERGRESERYPARYGGLLGHYLAAGIPIIHFLNIKGLALQAGIPVDGDPRASLPASILNERKTPQWPVGLGLVLAFAALAIRKPLG